MSLERNDSPNQLREQLQQARQETDRRSDDRRDDRRGQDDNRREERGSSRREDGYSDRYASLSEIGRKNAPPMPMGETGMALSAFHSDFVEALPSKDHPGIPNVKVFPIDGASADLPFSLVVVAGTKPGREEVGVGFHTFIIAGSAEPLPPRTESYRGEQYRIVVTPGMAYNRKMRDIVKEILQQNYPGKELITADAEAVYRGFPTAAKDNGEAIANCVKNSLAAISVAIGRRDPQAFELSLKKEDTSYNTIHVQHRQNHILDRGGLPVRADSIIDLISRDAPPNRNSRDPYDQAGAGRRISRVTGFYDFVYNPSEYAITDDNMRLSRRRDGRHRDEDYVLYMLRYVITGIDSIDLSLNTMLLALATANAMGEDSEILRAFEPNKSIGEDDFRNIGALAIEPNFDQNDSGVGERMLTKGSDFNTAKLSALIRTTVHPGIALALDVPDCSANTWQLVNFMALADGNADEQRRIYDAACRLTGGRFEDEFSRNDQMIDSRTERVYKGYYMEGDQRLSLDDIDYLAVLNLSRPETRDDLDLIQRWSRAAASRDDAIFSQSEQYDIITRFLQNATITDQATRLTLTPKFNAALVRSITACGLSLNPGSSARDSFERQRSSYGDIESVLNRPGSSGLYANQRSSRYRDEDRYNYDRDRRSGRY